MTFYYVYIFNGPFSYVKQLNTLQQDNICVQCSLYRILLGQWLACLPNTLFYSWTASSTTVRAEGSGSPNLAMWPAFLALSNAWKGRGLYKIYYKLEICSDIIFPCTARRFVNFTKKRQKNLRTWWHFWIVLPHCKQPYLVVNSLTSL